MANLLSPHPFSIESSSLTLVTGNNIPGTTGFGRTHWGCEHWIERRENTEAYEKAKIFIQSNT